VTIVGGGSHNVIDGFTVRNGLATQGGGICCLQASPLIAHNEITGNRATVQSAASYGGGIYCQLSHAKIDSNRIESNSAVVFGVLELATTHSGGGIYGKDSSLTITNNTVARNTATTDYGGAFSGAVLVRGKHVP